MLTPPSKQSARSYRAAISPEWTDSCLPREQLRSNDEDDPDTNEFYTTLTHAIDDVVDHANETQTPVKLTINDDGTKVTFELVSV